MNDEKNNVYLRGRVDTVPTLSYEIFGEGFYDFTLKVPRFSSDFDYIPITISSRILGQVLHGCEVTILGQLRSYNLLEGEKAKLILTVFVKRILENDHSKNPNVIAVKGYLCKEAVYRKTPLEREISDLLIAVNRNYGKSDYLPTIFWGRNARLARDMQVGEEVSFVGRVQSRDYIKKLEGDQKIQKRAYEVSATKIYDWENFKDVLEVESESLTSVGGFNQQ